LRWEWISPRTSGRRPCSPAASTPIHTLGLRVYSFRVLGFRL
jgi:hypothetical protein